MKKDVLFFVLGLVTFIALFFLTAWALSATSDFYYRLDALVGGEGPGGDGDAFALISFIATILNGLFLLFWGFKILRHKHF
jgi:hypothetical protein